MKRILTVVAIIGSVLLPLLAFAQNSNISPRTVNPKADVTVTGTATLVCASNDIRVNCTCTNRSTTTAVRYGDSTVTASTGAAIGPGQPIEMRIRGALYMASEGGSVTVSCTEETY